MTTSRWSVPLGVATGFTRIVGRLSVLAIGRRRRLPRRGNSGIWSWSRKPSVSDGVIAWLDERFRLGDVALLGRQPQCQNRRRMKQWTSP